MKAFFVALALVGVESLAAANVPDQFTVQGILRDDMGALQSMTVNVTVRFFDAQSGGNALGGDYPPSGPAAVMAQNGLFTITITDPSITTVLGSAASVWMEVQVGADIFPRQPVTSQIYALMAKQAEHAKQADSADHAGTADSATSATNAGHATSADHAGSADSATSATNAGHATSADSATSATNADSATSCANASQLGSVAASSYQRTLKSSCSSGISSIDQAGNVTCAAASGGTVTSVSAGSGLSGGTITSSGTLSVLFGSSGSTNVAARSNHGHAASCTARFASGGFTQGCNAGEVLVGGGCNCPGANGRVAATIVSGSSWACEMYNCGAGYGTQAICCTILAAN